METKTRTRSPKFASIGLVEIGEELARSRDSLPGPGLVDRFFHSFEEGLVCWQGQVVSRVDEDKYLVQLFEWLVGGESGQKIVSLQEMVDWDFYDDREHMVHVYETQWAPKADRAYRERQRKREESR